MSTLLVSVPFGLPNRHRHRWENKSNWLDTHWKLVVFKIERAVKWRNRPYIKSRKNREKKELVNWLTTLSFDVEIHLKDHKEKSGIYRPVSWLSDNQSSRKFVNLTISRGIGPIQSQDKTAKKGGGELVHHGCIWRRDTPSSSIGKIMNLSTCQLVSS
jgi:hypothetical protein